MKQVNRLLNFLNIITETIHSLINNIWPFMLLIGSILFFIGIITGIDIINSFSIGILLLVACFLICDKVYDNKVMILLGMAALALRFLISFIFNYVFKSFGMDSVEHHYMAYEVVKQLNRSVNYISIPFLKQYFPNLVAILYYFFGVNRLSATFITGFFSVLAGAIVYMTCRMFIKNSFAGKFSSLAIWFMPGFLFFTSDLLKDSSILLLTALSFYLFAFLVHLSNSNQQRFALFLLLVIVITINSAFRFYIFIPIVIGLGIGLVFYMLSTHNLKGKLIIGTAIISFSILFYTLVNRYLTRYMNLNFNYLFERINNEREWAFAYASAGIKGYDISTFPNALKALPMLCVHYLFQPFPTSWISNNSEFYIKLLVPDMIIWYSMFLCFFIGSYNVIIKKNIIGISILVYLIVFLCVNALVVGNVGAIYRYRLQFQLFAFVIVGIGMTHIFKGNKNMTSRLDIYEHIEQG